MLHLFSIAFNYLWLNGLENSFKAAMKAAKSETADKCERRAELAKTLANSHSFLARAKKILDVAASLKAESETTTR